MVYAKIYSIMFDVYIVLTHLDVGLKLLIELSKKIVARHPYLSIYSATKDRLYLSMENEGNFHCVFDYDILSNGSDLNSYSVTRMIKVEDSIFTLYSRHHLGLGPVASLRVILDTVETDYDFVNNVQDKDSSFVRFKKNDSVSDVLAFIYADGFKNEVISKCVNFLGHEKIYDVNAVLRNGDDTIHLVITSDMLKFELTSDVVTKTLEFHPNVTTIGHISSTEVKRFKNELMLVLAEYRKKRSDIISLLPVFR